MSTPEAVVRAAGGVVWRRGSGGQIDVVLVHRPRYDDWTLPKGKVDPGETDQEAAVREVAEEASIDVVLGAELPSTAYADHRGRSKSVRYWAMQVIAGAPAGSHEVDDARWFGLQEARRLLSYDRDRPVVDALAESVASDH